MRRRSCRRSTGRRWPRCCGAYGPNWWLLLLKVHGLGWLPRLAGVERGWPWLEFEIDVLTFFNGFSGCFRWWGWWNMLVYPDCWLIFLKISKSKDGHGGMEQLTYWVDPGRWNPQSESSQFRQSFFFSKPGWRGATPVLSWHHLDISETSMVRFAGPQGIWGKPILGASFIPSTRCWAPLRLINKLKIFKNLSWFLELTLYSTRFYPNIRPEGQALHLSSHIPLGTYCWVTRVTRESSLSLAMAQAFIQQKSPWPLMHCHAYIKQQKWTG